MLMNATVDSKIVGSELLLAGLELRLQAKEKIGVIGRNGVGKTTLFNILSGQDKEYDGSLDIKRGALIVSTAQEHHEVLDQSVLGYIVRNLPEYEQLKHIIDTYPATMGSNMKKIHDYSNALERFGQLDYYNIEDEITRALEAYQISPDKARSKMGNLSGGQKRFIELILVQFSHPDLALIDEPTNHMDFAAKEAFIEWLKAFKGACLVITHDRDVLGSVERIIELKDLGAVSYRGNYDAYLEQNSHQVTNSMQAHEIAQKTILNLKKQIEFAKARSAKGGPRWVTLRERYERELATLLEADQKPSFWIDQESVAALNPKITQKYDKYKAKNIRLAKSDDKERVAALLNIENIQLGYNHKPLFGPVSFGLSHGDRLHLIGRNGVGKTTLVSAITTVVSNQKSATLLDGTITSGRGLRISLYEQEISSELLGLKLVEAIETIYHQQNLAINTQQIMRIMGDYLFEPRIDGQKPVKNLSGGQKARLQLIRMLAGKPNLLILDEPTNHLDLPSIEELENALTNYHGAILYISHDSYFSKNIGGQSLMLKAA